VQKNSLNVWLVKTGEPSPVDDKDCRVMRTGMLANELVLQGHRVTWWDSCFNHQTKSFRFNESTRVCLPNGLECQFLLGCGYINHLSWARIKDHRQVAVSFASRALTLQKPDIIVAPYPTVELCAASAKYGKAHGIPVLADVRDLVPDSIYEYFHPFLRPLVRASLSKYERSARHALSSVDGIIGITQEFLDWGLYKAERRLSESDAVIHHCYDDKAVSEAQIVRAIEGWRARGITTALSTIICFFGVISSTQDFLTVIQGIRSAGTSLSGVTFVFCGCGPDLDQLRRRAHGISNVHFPGQVDAPSVVALMRMSRYGIAPYRSTLNYVGNIPNKFVEYMSSGLPVITPLRGVVRRLITEDGIGIAYEEGSPNGFRDAIVAAMGLSEDAYRSMSARVTRVFDGNFSRGSVMSRYVEHIERVALKGSRHGS
jgi:glycosyltransferase involved in cell wall biosynthesis